MQGKIHGNSRKPFEALLVLYVCKDLQIPAQGEKVIFVIEIESHLNKIGLAVETRTSEGFVSKFCRIQPYERVSSRPLG